jgi:Protein of unknown function (DUF4012)
MSRRGWLTLLILVPLGAVTIAVQIALLLGVVGAGLSAYGAKEGDAGALSAGTGLVARGAWLVDQAFDWPTTRAVRSNPLTFGAVDDLHAAVHAVAVGSTTLVPASDVAAVVMGTGGAAPLVSGGRVDTDRLPELAEPVGQIHEDLAATDAALAAIPGTGLLGRPISAVGKGFAGYVSALEQVTGALDTAMPVLPEALGADGPRNYLVTALNDAELFGSGGAPLSAFMVGVDKGLIEVPGATSGQLESKLSPRNPSIAWDHAGQQPWYRDDQRYPFVNSNFHPDFRTASTDMRRAWAALGYPEVEGVITLDMGALVEILDWTGPVRTAGFGTIDAGNLIRRVLVDAYRLYNTRAGVLQRHALNQQLTDAVASHVKSPPNLLPAMRAALAAIPPRHIQMSFDDPVLEQAVEELGAQAALQSGSGDLLGVWSQSGPNKLSVFQERSIVQEVELTEDGGATVHRTVAFTSAVPDGLEGDAATYRGYLALLARLRVAYRIPTTAVDPAVTVDTEQPLIAAGRVGPFPDERGGEVLWQGQDIPPGETVTAEVVYSLPKGTFPDGTYEVHADPQALSRDADLRIRVRPAPDTTLPDTNGWVRHGSSMTWSGTLDRPLHLRIG